MHRARRTATPRVTVYAIGSLLAAIPLTAATQGMRRRSLLLLAIAGFAIANTVTTLSSDYGLTIVARLLGGRIVGGLLLDHLGVVAFAPVLVALLLLTLAVVWSARYCGFSGKTQ